MEDTDYMIGYLLFVKRNLKDSSFWSDDLNICLLEQNVKHYICLTPLTTPALVNTVRIAKHGGGSIILWECFSVVRRGKLIRIEGRMNAVKLRKLLHETLLHSAYELIMG